ncbi:UNVERIFIED_CONTAM: Beta-1,4-xylosyltransferase IRX14 [Sesamum angustifolium]|uniref:Glycosyltransferases n=1 Tax=Sesamum angustifolium TaxID=2727405 RepID=A0AAW2NKG2_9LAMI
MGRQFRFGILAHSGGSEEGELPMVQRDNNEKDEKKSEVPVQGPACNSTNHLLGWHTFNTSPYLERSARYMGDRAVVLPRQLEWAGFVLNSRLVWEDKLEKPVWVKEWEDVDRDGEDVDRDGKMSKVHYPC